MLALGCGQDRVQSPVLNNKIGIREELVGAFPSVRPSLEDAAFPPLHLSRPFRSVSSSISVTVLKQRLVISPELPAL